MAERVAEGTLTFKRAGIGASRYPWDEWLDGTSWVLSKDEDYPGTETKYMAIRARLVGKKRGLRVQTTVDPKGEDTLGIKASPMGTSENGEAGEAPAPRKRGKRGKK